MCLFHSLNVQPSTESLPALQTTSNQNSQPHLFFLYQSAVFILRCSNNVPISMITYSYSVILMYSKTTFNVTLEFVCCSYNSKYIHVDLSILGIIFSHPPPHSEEEVAGREAVSTQRVTERVLRSETQLQATVGVSKGL